MMRSPPPPRWVRPAALVMPWDRVAVAAARLLDQAGQHLVRIEVLVGDGARRLRMPVVVALDLLDRGRRLLHGPEGEEALSDGQDVAEAGVLDDHGPAGGEVTGRPAAEPAGVAADVAVLGYAPLRLRAKNVVAVAVQVAADPSSIRDPPAHCAQ